MKVLFWVPYPNEGASNRYRVSQYLPYLDKAGIGYSLRSFWSSRSYGILYKKGHYISKTFYFLIGILSRVYDVFFSLYKYDVVFIHREAIPVGSAIFESLLKFCGKPFIFDFDDAIFLPSSSHYNNFIEKLKNPRKVRKIIRMSNAVIAGNRYLAEFAAQYNDKVCIIPTSIDTEKRIPDAKSPQGAPVTIGWIGSATTLDFLYPLKDVFRKVIERSGGNVRFKIVGGDFDAGDGSANIVSKPWSMKEEDSDLASFDIGIMPMPDNEWTRGKCGFKAILYMSAGIPCVSSPVGVNKEIIENGVNGFLAETGDEWVERLLELAGDGAKRARIGERGRKTVEERYSVKVNAPKFIDVIKNVKDRIWR